MSAMFYGPPGTSKTQLAKLIGEYLGWPTVIVDPSYVVQDGLDHLYARASHLFSILANVERVVVLLDEFDELGRDRAHETEVLSRFITTAMLPKLAAINDERKIVFLLATNYLTRFDAAFRRGGRFDMVIQVMPPTYKAKAAYAEWQPGLDAALVTLTNDERRLARLGLEDLTYLEMDQLVIHLKKSSVNVREELNKAFAGATLNRANMQQKTWKTTSEEEANETRLPAITN
jgi:SpoVK/Ycf46/Vps4 family AAA+-type ATPase